MRKRVLASILCFGFLCLIFVAVRSLPVAAQASASGHTTLGYQQDTLVTGTTPTRTPTRMTTATPTRTATPTVVPDPNLQRVSVASNGAVANGPSDQPDISADGRYVAFASDATNLVPGDTNGQKDIFVHDRETGQTTRISVSSAGVQSNAESRNPAISGDGRYVAFSSFADNLVSDDTDQCPGWHSCQDVFVHDRLTRETVRVSVASDGTQASAHDTGVWIKPSISDDGRYVAFDSAAPNLVEDDNNNYCDSNGDGFPDTNCSDAFVHDRLTGETTLVSVNSDGVQASGTSMGAVISPDGRYAAFVTNGSNLAPSDNGYSFDLYVHDRITGQTSLITKSIHGYGTNGFSGNASLSADARYVAFNSSASDLIVNDTNNMPDIFVYDRATEEMRRVSVTSSGGQAEGYNHFWFPSPSITGGGRYVVFDFGTANLVPGDTNEKTDIFMHDRVTRKTTRVSVTSAGTQGNEHSSAPSISANGQYVAFASDARNFFVNDNDINGSDIFVRRLPIDEPPPPTVTATTTEPPRRDLYLPLVRR